MIAQSGPKSIFAIHTRKIRTRIGIRQEVTIRTAIASSILLRVDSN